ncbi:MAG: recombinase family protein [Terriglobia bacterium]
MPRSCKEEFFDLWQEIMKAAIYARVSTSQGQAVEMQLRDLRELAARRGFAIVGKYCDEGVSGARDSRPALDRMLADAHAGKFNVVLVWKLDPLGRSLVHLVRLMEYFRGLAIELVSFSEGLDFTTTTGKLLFQIISAFAEFERDCIRERVLAGMRNARAKGKRIGRPPRTLLTQEMRRAITEAYRRGEGSLRQLAIRYGTTASTVQRCVKSYEAIAAKASVPA